MSITRVASYAVTLAVHTVTSFEWRGVAILCTLTTLFVYSVVHCDNTAVFLLQRFAANAVGWQDKSSAYKGSTVDEEYYGAMNKRPANIPRSCCWLHILILILLVCHCTPQIDSVRFRM